MFVCVCVCVCVYKYTDIIGSTFSVLLHTCTYNIFISLVYAYNKFNVHISWRPKNMIYIDGQSTEIYLYAYTCTMWPGDMCGIEEVGVQMGWGGVERY